MVRLIVACVLKNNIHCIFVLYPNNPPRTLTNFWIPPVFLWVCLIFSLKANDTMTLQEFKQMCGAQQLEFKAVANGKEMAKVGEYTLLSANGLKWEPPFYVYSGFGATTSDGSVIEDKKFFFLSNKSSWDEKATTRTL